MDQCTPGFGSTIVTLGDSGLDCATAPAVMSVRSPGELVNWTLPVVEFLVIGLALAGLVHAVLWWRQRRDPTNLALWFGTVVYVLVLEPVTYFPHWFGLQEEIGLIFVHNLFSVNFLWDRLPLYILAIYPAQAYLAFALVQRTGLLARRGPVLGAAAVATVFHLLYEIFDQLGPQLRWWAWNPQAPSNQVMVDSVPLSSAAVFAVASPFGVALLTLLLVQRRVATGPVPPVSMALRVIGIGALAPVLMTVLSLPYGVFAQPGAQNRTGMQVGLWLIIAVVSALGVLAVLRTLRECGGRLPGLPALTTAQARYPIVAAGVYLVVFLGLWAAALPDWFAAQDGVTTQGTPTGNLVYVGLCTVGFAASIVLAAVSARPPDTDRSAVQSAETDEAASRRTAR